MSKYRWWIIVEKRHFIHIHNAWGGFGCIKRSISQCVWEWQFEVVPFRSKHLTSFTIIRFGTQKLGYWYYSSQGTCYNSKNEGMDSRVGKEKAWENYALSKALLVNKYKDTVFNSPDADSNNFYVDINEIRYVWGRDCCWTIFGVCDMEGVDDEKLTPFVAITLIWKEQRTSVGQNRNYNAWTW